MMKRFQPAVAALLLFALFHTLYGQRPSSSSGQDATPTQDERVRVTTNLVQVDIVVTDKDGRQVTDLRPEEFEITEDGKRQPITNFSYISSVASSAPSGTIEPVSNTPSTTADKTTAAIVPPAKLKPGQVRRTLVFLVDDLGVSFQSMGYVRKALRKFVDEQMQPGDLAVIMRTSGGTGALQQLTADKRLLYAAIENIRWLPSGRGGVSYDSNINPAGEQQTDIMTREGLQDIQAFRSDILTAGTIGTINLTLRGMQDMPGRKSIILFSENARLFDASGTRSERLIEMMKQMADYSNRASAVVYTIDASGLQTLETTAAQGANNAKVVPELSLQGGAGPPPQGTRAAGRQGINTGGEEGLRALGALSETARATYFESQDVLKYLADLTGGIAIKNTNDIGNGIERVLEDQKGYYLIGYRPEESTIDPKTGQRRALKVNVKVKRPGLRARSRSSFYGLTDEEKPVERRTRDQQLMAALNSPFAGDVRLRVTSLFGDEQSSGSYVRAMVYVDARDLKFSEAGGENKAALDIVVLTTDAGGRIVDQVSRTETVSAKGDAFKRVLEHGLTYALSVPVKQAGAYQLRVAVRDTQSERTGSASQFIGVPDLAKGGLTLSGIALSGISLAAATQNVKEEQDPQAGPAVRRLKHGMVLDYGYVIYNAQLDKSTNAPQVTTQVRLYRDGKAIFTGRVTPLDMSRQKDMKRLVAGGRIQVATEMSPGDYVLQVIVTDALVKDKDKRRTATQWIDFEVVK